jgi:hypothetical protein
MGVQKIDVGEVEDPKRFHQAELEVTAPFESKLIELFFYNFIKATNEKIITNVKVSARVVLCQVTFHISIAYCF